MVQGQVFLKVGAGTFDIYFFQGLSFLNSVENFFFCQHNFVEKVILSCLKMNLCVYVKKIGVLN